MAGLISLPPDALLSILCRVPAKDQNQLRLTCRTIRAIVDSASFFLERSRLGWIETQATLLSKEELYRKYNPSEFDDDGYDEEILRDQFNELGEYDREYGCHSIEARLWVDGKLAGTAKLVLVDGTLVVKGLLHKAAGASHELQMAALTFCDKNGNPRVESLKHANASATGGFLYIKQFEVNQQYRSYTNVTASALRSLLCETKLTGKWSLAVYLADAESHFTLEDEERVSRLNGTSGAQDFSLTEEVSKHLDRCNELNKIDAAPFLRAGFFQAMNTLVGENTYQFFASPTDISVFPNDTSIPVVDRPFLGHVIDTDDGMLIELVSEYKYQRDAIANNEWGERSQIYQIDEEFQQKAMQLLQDRSITIKGSRVLHWCASNRFMECIEFLLSLVPSNERRSALNSFDQLGQTPLMCAAQTISISVMPWDYAKSLDIQKKYSVCQHLLALGADRNLVNPLDLKSSLGYFRTEIRAIQDHEDVHNYTSSWVLNRGRIESVERLLSPMIGPTDADNFVLDSTRNKSLQQGIEEQGNDVDIDMDEGE